MKIRRIFILTVFLGVVGCAENVHSVNWYKQNEPERQQKIEQCENDPGRLRRTPNCLNAEQARIEVSAETRGNIPVGPYSPRF